MANSLLFVALVVCLAVLQPVRGRVIVNSTVVVSTVCRSALLSENFELEDEVLNQRTNFTITSTSEGSLSVKGSCSICSCYCGVDLTSCRCNRGARQIVMYGTQFQVNTELASTSILCPSTGGGIFLTATLNQGVQTDTVVYEFPLNIIPDTCSLHSTCGECNMDRRGCKWCGSCASPNSVCLEQPCLDPSINIQVPCETFSSCNSCGAVDGCKWCVDGTCRAETDLCLGASCVGDFQATCAQFTSCQACPTEYCKWCGVGGSGCVPKGTSPGFCNVGYSCDGPQVSAPCDQIRDCYQCVQSPGCEYCQIDINGRAARTRGEKVNEIARVFNRDVDAEKYCTPTDGSCRAVSAAGGCGNKDVINAQPDGSGCADVWVECACNPATTCNGHGDCDPLFLNDESSPCVCDPGWEIGANCNVVPQQVIKVEEVEITQGLQDWENSIPLVSGKPTAVRVFVTASAPINDHSVPAKLKLTYDNIVGQTSIVVVGAAKLPTSRTGLDRRRSDTSFTFILPESVLSGGVISMEFIPTVHSRNCNGKCVFAANLLTDVPSLPIHIIPLGQGGVAPPSFNAIARNIEWLKNTFGARLDVHKVFFLLFSTLSR